MRGLQLSLVVLRLEFSWLWAGERRAITVQSSSSSEQHERERVQSEKVCVLDVGGGCGSLCAPTESCRVCVSPPELRCMHCTVQSTPHLPKRAQSKEGADGLAGKSGRPPFSPHLPFLSFSPSLAKIVRKSNRCCSFSPNKSRPFCRTSLLLCRRFCRCCCCCSTNESTRASTRFAPMHYLQQPTGNMAERAKIQKLFNLHSRPLVVKFRSFRCQSPRAW